MYNSLYCGGGWGDAPCGGIPCGGIPCGGIGGGMHSLRRHSLRRHWRWWRWHCCLYIGLDFLDIVSHQLQSIIWALLQKQATVDSKRFNQNLSHLRWHHQRIRVNVIAMLYYLRQFFISIAKMSRLDRSEE